MVPKMFILTLIVGSACAATWMGNLPMKPKELMHKEGCFVKEINDVIPFGETITPLGHCYRISCGSSTMHYASCGVVASFDPRCHKVETDLSKPYPDCCARFKCDTENDIVKGDENKI